MFVVLIDLFRNNIEGVKGKVPEVLITLNVEVTLEDIGSSKLRLFRGELVRMVSLLSPISRRGV